VVEATLAWPANDVILVGSVGFEFADGLVAVVAEEISGLVVVAFGADSSGGGLVERFTEVAGSAAFFTSLHDGFLG
jgi:hypothetical protein